ncbi:MAG TPA: metal ABC transporter ATP-binding protein [Syntrophales bacterium]|jgi:zinc transport system ATP-binding protein|nr:metal ABC transporter ATP-binding protein [Syntrophales bacterium]HPX55582.1 metal ABC transporter ATP-binding protein [Syntrophales bacterium]HQA81798.1 metal ABC transporter ATP-binding protein [Syntrophales bacterium]
MTDTPLIRIRNLSFGYSDRLVLEKINLDIYPKDFILLIGPNGGGKTTLVKLILGIIQPREGSAQYEPDLATRLGYVPQFSNFNKNFPVSVYDFVLMGRCHGHNYLRRYRKEDRIATDQILKRMDLYDLHRKGMNHLSGGQVQRALIARALVSDPLVLFLDEPTTSIDATSQINLLEFLESINREMAILVITHDPTPFASTYKHIACLNRELYYHSQGELDHHTLEKVYGCPVELLGHGIPHTMLHRH